MAAHDPAVNLLSLTIGLGSGIVIGIVGNVLSKQENIDEWVQSSDQEQVVQRAFRLSAKLAERTFGKKLFSIQALIVSFGLSIIIFGISLLLALYTTPGLGKYLERGGLAEGLIVAVLVVSEYIYVTKTRVILKVISKEYKRVWKISGFFMLDLITTYWILVVMSAFIIVMAIYIEQIHDKMLDASHNLFAIVAGVPGRKASFVAGYWNAFSLYDYLLIMVKLIGLLYIEAASKFNAFLSIELWTKFAQLKSGGEEYKYITTIPFTTIVASAFATTAWISLCWVAGMGTLFCCKALYVTGMSARFLTRPVVAGSIATAVALGTLVYFIVSILASP